MRMEEKRVFTCNQADLNHIICIIFPCWKLGSSDEFFGNRYTMIYIRKYAHHVFLTYDSAKKGEKNVCELTELNILNKIHARIHTCGKQMKK